MITQPKYSIGQTVYRAGYRSRTVTSPCPDCQGTGEWSVTTPAGETFTMTCGTCCQYLGQPDLQRTVYEPHVTVLTLGLIGLEADTTGVRYRYMANETGIGTGTVHREEDLSATYEQAESLSRLLAHKVQVEHDARVKRNREEQRRKARRKPCKACGR